MDGAEKRPSEPVTSLRSLPVSSLCTRTCALGMAAPVASATLPAMAPPTTCACNAGASNRAARAARMKTAKIAMGEKRIRKLRITVVPPENFQAHADSRGAKWLKMYLVCGSCEWRVASVLAIPDNNRRNGKGDRNDRLKRTKRYTGILSPADSE